MLFGDREKESKSHSPDLLSVENNHQVSQWNSMCAMTDGENGSRRILTLAPTEGYGDKKSKEMGWTEPCLGLCGKAYEPTQGAGKVKATGPGISLNLQSKRPWWQIKNTFVWLKWSEKLTWINMSVQVVRIKNYYKAIVLSASLSGTGKNSPEHCPPSTQGQAVARGANTGPWCGFTKYVRPWVLLSKSWGRKSSSSVANHVTSTNLFKFLMLPVFWLQSKDNKGTRSQDL